MKTYNLKVQCSKQEDGLWRAEVPGFQGCWVDAPTLHQALSEIQEVAAMLLDLAAEAEKPLPDSVTQSEQGLTATLPIVVGEHNFKRIARSTSRSTVR